MSGITIEIHDNGTQFSTNLEVVKVFEVADFALPSDKIAKSLGTAEGQLLVCVSPGVFVALDPPDATGQNLVADLTLTGLLKWATQPAATHPQLTNKTANSVDTGTVAVQSTGTDSAFATTTTERARAIGVVGETIGVDAAGTVKQVGTAIVLVQGNVAKGEYIITSGTAGRGKATTDPSNAFAIALTAYAGGGAGSVTALLMVFHPSLSNDGWVSPNATWTYATAVTITVPSGAAAIYDVGDKARWKEGGAYKYAYIVAVADTQLTIKGDTFAGGAITDNYYSKASSPNGFPGWFAYTPTGIANSNVTLTGRFMMVGRIVHGVIKAVFTGTITFTTMPTLPIAASANRAADMGQAGVAGYLDSGTAYSLAGLIPCVLASATVLKLTSPASVDMSATSPITWNNNDQIQAQFSYEI